MFSGLGADDVSIYRKLYMSYWVYAEENCVYAAGNFLPYRIL